MGRTNTTKRGGLPRPEVRTDDDTLTRFAGLVPLLVFATEVVELPRRLREIVGPAGRRRIHPVHHVLMAFIIGSLAGVTRLAHLDWLRDDAVLLKYLRLGHWPVRKVFSTALARLTDSMAEHLEALVAEVGRPLAGAVASAVIDIDNTALVDHGTREGSVFGYCGKGRRRRRHYPLVASLAATRAVFMTKYRGGTAMTGEEIAQFLCCVVQRARDWFGATCAITLRGDAGFVSKRVLSSLHELGVAYVLAHPMSAALKTMLMNAAFSPSPELFTDHDEDIEFAVVDGSSLGHPVGSRVVVVRRRVHDPSAPPQGKKVQWSPDWRYQAIVTDRQGWSAADVWRFYNDRADCERVFRTGKQGLGLGNFVGQTLAANRAAFLLRLLAFNLDLRFAAAARAAAANADDTSAAEPSPPKNAGLLWRQRYFFCTPARLLREHCRWLLRTPPNRLLRGAWLHYGPVGRLTIAQATEVTA